MFPPGSVTLGDGTTVQVVPSACAPLAPTAITIVANAAAAMPVQAGRAALHGFGEFIMFPEFVRILTKRHYVVSARSVVLNDGLYRYERHR